MALRGSTPVLWNGPAGRRPYVKSWPGADQAELRALNPSGGIAGANEKKAASPAFNAGSFTGGETRENLAFTGRRQAQGCFLGKQDAKVRTGMDACQSGKGEQK